MYIYDFRFYCIGKISGKSVERRLGDTLFTFREDRESWWGGIGKSDFLFAIVGKMGKRLQGMEEMGKFAS